jgi:hypothetical protein
MHPGTSRFASELRELAPQVAELPIANLKISKSKLGVSLQLQSQHKKRANSLSGQCPNASPTFTDTGVGTLRFWPGKATL